MLQVFTVWGFDVCYFVGSSYLMEMTWARRSGGPALLLKCVTRGNFLSLDLHFLIFNMGTIPLSGSKNRDGVCRVGTIGALPFCFLTQKGIPMSG